MTYTRSQYYTIMVVGVIDITVPTSARPSFILDKKKISNMLK